MARRSLTTLAPRFRTGDALRVGVTRRRLRGRDLDRSVYGVRATSVGGDERARYALLMTRLGAHVFLSHVSAARVHGIPLPTRWDPAEATHVSATAPHRAPHARGLRGHSLRVQRGDLTRLGSLRLTTGARTWIDLGRMLPVADLVAAGDYLLHERRATFADLGRRVSARRGQPGFARLAEALRMLSRAAESPAESALRMVIVHAGFQTPEVNRVVGHRADGRGIRVDLSYPGARLAIEYQGDYHRERAQWRDDIRRRGELEDQGWTVLEATGDDLRDPTALIRRLHRLGAPRA